MGKTSTAEANVKMIVNTSLSIGLLKKNALSLVRLMDYSMSLSVQMIQILPNTIETS
jgi:hypothetical protein